MTKTKRVAGYRTMSRNGKLRRELRRITTPEFDDPVDPATKSTTPPMWNRERSA
jgi:hypothetical protein